jgi:glycogen synthase
MRILHVFDHSLPLQSGYVSRSVGILRSQNARGWHTIHLTSPRHRAAAAGAAATETIDGLTFHRAAAPATSLPILREIAEMKATAQRLAELVRAERPDILHAHSPVLNALPALSVGRRFGIPVVYEIRALWEDAAVDHGRTREGALRYRASRRVETFAMRRVDRLVALCEPLRQEIIGRGLPAEKITVVPNAVDASFLAPRPPADGALRQSLGLENRTVLGFIGSFYSYEGLDLLIEAVPMLSRQVPDFAILLVGGGPEEQKLRGMVAERGLEDRVKFVARVKLEEVARYYGIVDILVYPRRRMRLTDLVTPLKPLEAMAQMTPLVASDVGGHRELIRHGDTGYLFAADDAAALAAAVASAVADPANRARIVRNGRHFVETERSWTAVVERYAEIYESLLAAPARRQSAQ